ncbi:hypothetical protein [Bradyrhizobium sp. CCBAU 45389]|uniref:hypothetical protein n=1 Tax=Bradyrhizobium sp. CCBAU 45389 TaxID=858429 RepID=UPI002306934B|nr:hypothetical protein [Bradyrhizobium sp. CCBAU 45389]
MLPKMTRAAGLPLQDFLADCLLRISAAGLRQARDMRAARVRRDFQSLRDAFFIINYK